MSSQRLVLKLESFSGYWGQRELGSRVRGRHTASVGDGGKGAGAKACSGLSVKEGKEHILPRVPCRHLDFSPMRPKSKVQTTKL